MPINIFNGPRPRTTEDVVAEVMRAPMTRWRAIMGTLDPQQRLMVASALAELSSLAARAEAYANRTGYDCGPQQIDDHTHAAAVKASNKNAAAVRKALGYSYPNQPVNF